MMKSRNPRAQRTRQALQESLLLLIVEQGYERTTVQDILDHAGLGRATFYTHFENKEELLRSGLERLRALLESASREKGASKKPLAFSLAFFRHVDGHRRLYRAMVGREAGAVVDRELRRLLAELIRKELSASRATKRDRELAVQYVVGGMMSAVTWWLDYSVALTPEEIERTFRRMTLPGLEAILS